MHSIVLTNSHTHTRTDRSADQRVIEPRCNATYIPSAVSYDLAISWTLADPLVLEAVKDSEYKMELIPEVRFPDTEMLSYFPPVSTYARIVYSTKHKCLSSMPIITLNMEV